MRLCFRLNFVVYFINSCKYFVIWNVVKGQYRLYAYSIAHNININATCNAIPTTQPTRLTTTLPITLPTTSTTSDEYTIITKQELKSTRLTAKHDPKWIQGTTSMDYGERRSHAWSLHASQYTSHMIAARVKQEETDTRTTAKDQYETWEEGIGDL